MSQKDAHSSKTLPENYLGYFKCFNHGDFFEAHDVLEELWLKDRQSANYSFYKGLIQLAGAFVHLQKNLEDPKKFQQRLHPAAALFKLAQTNLKKYPPHHEHLDLAEVLNLIEGWLKKLEANNFEVNPLAREPAPILTLLP